MLLFDAFWLLLMIFAPIIYSVWTAREPRGRKPQ